MNKEAETQIRDLRIAILEVVMQSLKDGTLTSEPAAGMAAVTNALCLSVESLIASSVGREEASRWHQHIDKFFEMKSLKDMTTGEKEKEFPWLHLLCDACHTKLTTHPELHSPFDLCERCQSKFIGWCETQDEGTEYKQY